MTAVSGIVWYVGRTRPVAKLWCLDETGAAIDLSSGFTFAASLRQRGGDATFACTITPTTPTGDGTGNADTPTLTVTPSAGALDAATPGPAELIVVATAGAAVEEWHFPVTIRT